jgi:pimeloyl-ACP methyl ester carboxylesterase
MMKVIISNMLFDGTSERKDMFVGFEGDEITYVGNSKPQENYEIILEEAKQNHSIVVTPSFIDPHSHIGHKVIAVQLPLHSLSDDVATVKRAVEHVGGPTILVGPPYGGAVITNAGYNNPNVKGLVYIAAFAPDEGQSLSTFVNPANFPKGLFIVDSGGFIYLNPKIFRENFAQDVDPAEADIMAIVQKPFHQSNFVEKSGPPAWKQLPTWYQISDADHMIPPDVQRLFAQRMNATTLSLNASHVSYVSHPNEIAQVILFNLS